METVCMHCRRLRNARGRWVTVAEAHIAELRDAGQLAYGACFACTRALFAPDPEPPAEARMEWQRSIGR